MKIDDIIIIKSQELAEKAKGDGVEKTVVGAVIKDKDKALLLERNSNEFMGGLVELASGKIEKGETILDGLQREVLEETGLQISEIHSYIGSFDYKSGSGKNCRQFNFFIKVKSLEDLKLNPEEHCNYYYLTKTEIESRRYNISDKTKNILLKAL